PVEEELPPLPVRRFRPPRRRRFAPRASPELEYAREQSSKTLFIVAGLNFVLLGMSLFVLPHLTETRFPPRVLRDIKTTWIFMTLLFTVLGLIARWEPLTPTGIGVLFYVCVVFHGIGALSSGELEGLAYFQTAVSFLVNLALLIALLKALLASIHA